MTGTLSVAERQADPPLLDRQYLDLTLPVESHHLEGLLPPFEDDAAEGSVAYEPPRVQTLVLDSSRITDEAAGAISACRDLRSLHVAETRISSALLCSGSRRDLLACKLTWHFAQPVSSRPSSRPVRI